MKTTQGRRRILKRMLTSLLIALGLGSLLAVLFPPLYTVAFVFHGVWYAERAQVRLLCETDHQVLLEACRELSRRVATGELKPGRYYVRRDRAPEASTFPQPILDLRPSYVYIYDDAGVRLEMLGGLDHVGVQAYPEDFKEPYPNFSYGGKELIPGLWYYDDGYEGNPKHQKKIEALLQKRQ